MITIPEQIMVSPSNKTRTRSKKLSVDSRTNNNEEIVLDDSDNIEVNLFVSKSKEEDKKNIENIGGDINLPSIGSINNAKSESIVKEIPLSDEQQRLNQSETINNEQDSAIEISNDDNKLVNICFWIYILICCF